MSQKGFAPILIVLLIAAVVGGYFVYQNQTKPTLPPIAQPTPSQIATPAPTDAGTTVYTEVSQTANWKTNNSNLGFSFKYPQNFWITSSETRKKDLIEHGDSPPAPRGTVGSIQIITSEVDSADGLINKGTENTKVINEKTIPINQYPSKYAELESAEDNNTISLLVSIQKDNSYAIYLSVTNYHKAGEPGISKTQLRSTFNQILSTFKFTQ